MLLFFATDLDHENRPLSCIALRPVPVLFPFKLQGHCAICINSEAPVDPSLVVFDFLSLFLVLAQLVHGSARTMFRAIARSHCTDTVDCGCTSLLHRQVCCSCQIAQLKD